VSSKRGVKRKQCGNKVGHPNRDFAMLARKLLKASYPGDKFDVYKCKWCHQWHVGHRKHTWR
jgi:hypothetical protein